MAAKPKAELLYKITCYADGPSRRNPVITDFNSKEYIAEVAKGSEAQLEEGNSIQDCFIVRINENVKNLVRVTQIYKAIVCLKTHKDEFGEFKARDKPYEIHISGSVVPSGMLARGKYRCTMQWTADGEPVGQFQEIPMRIVKRGQALPNPFEKPFNGVKVWLDEKTSPMLTPQSPGTPMGPATPSPLTPTSSGGRVSLLGLGGMLTADPDDPMEHSVVYDDHPDVDGIVHKVFEAYDDDHSGFIDEEEFTVLAFSLGKNLSQDEIRAVFTRVDADHDGRLSFAEFAQWWQSSLTDWWNSSPDASSQNLDALSARFASFSFAEHFPRHIRNLAAFLDRRYRNTRHQPAGTAPIDPSLPPRKSTYPGTDSTALLLAAAADQPAAVEAVLAAGAAPGATSKQCAVTPLHLAVADNLVEVASVLLRAGANAAEAPGSLPLLHMAVALGHAGLVAPLVASGADAKAVHSGFSPAAIAAATGDAACQAALSAAGAPAAAAGAPEVAPLLATARAAARSIQALRLLLLTNHP